MMKFINIGFGNMVSAGRIVAIASPDSAPIKRLVQDARDDGRVIDVSCGRRTRAVIITDSDHVILSAIQTETITNRAAACLLMPDFIVEKMLMKYNNGNKVTIYSGSTIVIPNTSKSVIQMMADSMGVSYSACYYRLKELSVLDERPLEEYVTTFILAGAEHV